MAQLRAVAVINAVPDPGMEVVEVIDDLRALIEAAVMELGVVVSLIVEPVEPVSRLTADIGDDLIDAAIDISSTAHNQEAYL